MSNEEYIGKLLKHSDARDACEIQRALDIARYGYRHKPIVRAVSSAMLDKVHISWRVLDGWMNTEVALEESTWLNQWEYLETIAQMAQELANESERIEAEQARISRMLWDMVICLGDPIWLHRIVSEAEAQYFSYLAWQLMRVRQASKVALLMLEFNSDYDICVERF